jgi:RNA polymerase sigma-70 factor (ECF subfamily)
MPADDLPLTSASLFQQLYNPNNSEEAWRTFLSRYQPAITAWCRRQNLQEADAQEVTSDVLLRLALALPSFQYDPQKRFRSWLQTVVRNAIRNFWRDRAGRPGARGRGSTDVMLLLEQVPDGEVAQLVEHVDSRLQADLALAEQAAQRVRNEVHPSTWQAFWQTAVEGRPGPEVAAELGLSVASVYMAKKRVADRLRQAAADLQGQGCDAEPAS